MQGAGTHTRAVLIIALSPKGLFPLVSNAPRTQPCVSPTITRDLRSLKDVEDVPAVTSQSLLSTREAFDVFFPTSQKLDQTANAEMLAEENRSRGIKIQVIILEQSFLYGDTFPKTFPVQTQTKVGTYSNSSKKQVLLESIQKKDIAQQTASAAASKAAISVTSTTTLYDLCDSSYNLKFCKRERKKKGPLSAEEKLAAEVKNKNAILENSRASSSSSSSSSSKRAEIGGMGPRVEIVNGKIIVRESSLVSAFSSLLDIVTTRFTC